MEKKKKILQLKAGVRDAMNAAHHLCSTTYSPTWQRVQAVAEMEAITATVVSKPAFLNTMFVHEGVVLVLLALRRALNEVGLSSLTDEGEVFTKLSATLPNTPERTTLRALVALDETYRTIALLAAASMIAIERESERTVVVAAGGVVQNDEQIPLITARLKQIQTVGKLGVRSARANAMLAAAHDTVLRNNAANQVANISERAQDDAPRRLPN